MKRVHIHVATQDLAGSRRFYQALFGVEPAVEREDYLKWSLSDPPLNLAVSTFAGAPGINHLGIELESDAQLPELGSRLLAASSETEPEPEVECCYHRSTKLWATDPQGVSWENFRSHGLASETEKVPLPPKAAACCETIDNTARGCCS
jgi:catechol 2,3-dioxygenase-like lactoylglutathione lyase family enzyme